MPAEGGHAGADLVRAALAIAEQSGGDPGRVRRQAAILAGRPGLPAEAASVAQRALGVAARELGDLPGAERHLRRAIAIGTRAGLVERVAEARMSRALVAAARGDSRGAVRELELAAPALTGLAGARWGMQRALVLQRLGRLDEALAAYRTVLPALRRDGDTLWEAWLHNNRGVLHAYRGAAAQAERDLLRAAALERRLGRPLQGGMIQHNLGFAAALRGDVPAALDWYDEAQERFRRLGVHPGLLLIDRAEVLLSVRLLDEARLAAEHAVAEYERRGMRTDLAEARVVLAQAALADGDAVAARAAATRAHRAFVVQRRPAWAALAGYVLLRARWQTETPSQALLATARRTAERLARAGWRVPALDARLIAARLALHQGRSRVARRELTKASAARRRGPAELRVRAWHAEALRRLADGHRSGAERALRAGARVVEQYRATLGSTELRAHVSAHLAEVATLGLRLALEERRPERVLAWSERWRAGALRHPPVRRRDAALDADLTALRAVVARLDQAVLEGRGTRALLRSQTDLEEAIRRRAHRARGDADPSGDEPPTVAALSATLGGRALVAYVALEGELHAVAVADGTARLHRLGDRHQVAGELEALRFAARRLLRGSAPARSRDAARQAAAFAAQRLDDLLLGGLRRDVADRDLVVVPTGALHALPWGVLPSCRGRALTVAPSARSWQAASFAPKAPAAAAGLLAAGPGLAAAEGEVAALARQYPDARRLAGKRATAAAVLAGLEGAAFAHLACHGRFRADNPLFSHLRLADGPVTVYDVERLSRPPPLLVLSACESALSDLRPGDELMGFTAALLHAGAGTLVGSVLPVPDHLTRVLMVAFHRRLRAGTPPAVALAAAQSETADDAAADWGRLASGFVCLGAGWPCGAG